MRFDVFQKNENGNQLIEKSLDYEVAQIMVKNLNSNNPTNRYFFSPRPHLDLR